MDWLRSIWDGLIMLNGIGRVEDAVRASDVGVDAVVLSNGGRQLYGAPATYSNARLDELAAEADRDPGAIIRASSLSLDDLDTARKHAAKWRDAGDGYLVCGWPEGGRARIETFVNEVLPELAD